MDLFLLKLLEGWVRIKWLVAAFPHSCTSTAEGPAAARGKLRVHSMTEAAGGNPGARTAFPRAELAPPGSRKAPQHLQVTQL